MANILPLELDVIKGAIKEILKNADLNSLSSKKVRKILEDRFKTDLTQQKQQIDDLLMELINAEEENNSAHKSTKITSAEQRNGKSDKEDEQVESDDDEDEQDEKSSSDQDDSSSDSLTKPSMSQQGHHQGGSRKRARSGDRIENGERKNKKTSIAFKKSKSSATASGYSSEKQVDDEALARKLQQEELGVRPRNSRRIEKKPKKTPKEREPRKKGNSTYSQECVLSEELASVMGTNKMARKDVVSRMWQIFRERSLQDPLQRQYVICDEQLERVFKVKKFKAFGMMKFLKNHMKDARLVQQS